MEWVNENEDFGVAEHDEESDWNYEADLDLLKLQLSQATFEETARVRNLISVCLNRTQIKKPDLTGIGDDSDFLADLAFAEDDEYVNISPLDIPMIFEGVLDYLPLKALLNCRLVSRSWNANSVPFIRQKQLKRLEIDPTKFATFWDTFEKTELLLFRKLGVLLEPQTRAQCLEFFAKHGHSIEDLQLEPNSYHSVKELLKTIRKILGHVSSLKKLTMDVCGNADEEEDDVYEELKGVVLDTVETLQLLSGPDYSEKCFTAVLAMFPNLKSFRVRSCSHNLSDWNLDSALKNLRIHTLLRGGTYDQMRSWKAIQATQRLKELRMWVVVQEHSSRLMVEAQQAFLTSQSESLEVLTLTSSRYIRNDDDDEYEDSPQLLLPLMKALKTLNFTLEPEPESKIAYPSGIFASLSIPVAPIQPDQVPSLQSIQVDARLLLETFEDDVFTSVQQLDLSVWKGAHTLILEEISSRFPNLKKMTHFYTQLEESEMSLISSCLENIEELELDISNVYKKLDMKNLNLVIGGISPRSKWLLSELIDLLGLEAVLKRINPPGPSFRDLKRLTKLRLSFDLKGRDRSLVRFDEVGVICGFLRLPRELKLTLAGDFCMPSDLQAKMTSHFQDVYFNPTTVPSPR